MFHKRGADGSGKGDILQTKCTTDHVYGALYRMVPEEKRILDAIEGLGRGYNEVRMEDRNGEQFFCYVADSTAIDSQLKPFTWYHQLVVAGAKWHNFPYEYVRQVEQFASVPDPDRQRAEEHLAILRSVGFTRG
ncbi:MAG: gamma-glutamylcyclotransferase [Myxococcales bacterium]|nr:gamma-glutamylcyclotransferase [Myxococcales bacterium]